MFTYARLFYFIIAFYSCSYLESAVINPSHNLVNMSCNALVLGLIKESSFYKTYSKLDLTFGFERDNDRYLGIVFARKLENNRHGVYANCELDLIKRTLNNIDRDQAIPIKINKEYIPFIAAKCTSNENVYLNTAKLPD